MSKLLGWLAHPLFLLALALVLTNSISVANDEEVCTRDPETGHVDCEGDRDHQEIWLEEHGDDDNPGEIHESIPLLADGFDELQLELLVEFFGYLKDWKPSTETLSNYSPEDLVTAVMNTFAVFDGNDDGLLQYEEVQKVLSNRKTPEDLAKIEDIFNKNNGELSIFQYLNFFKRLGGGKDMIPLLSPFDKLSYMPPLAAKRIILGSVHMFKESDEDHNGKLDKKEFALGMQRSKERKGEELKHMELPEEQIHSLFDLMDKDKDEYLTYAEFQATMPQQQKSLEEATEDIFKETDLNSDGELSEEEFKLHMNQRATTMKVQAPTADQLDMAFEKLDADGNGKLSLNEMKSLFQEAASVQEKRMMEAFASFDQDGDGVLSLDELEGIVAGIEKTTGQKIDTKVFMTMLDTDSDGQVSMTEMQSVLTKMAATK